MEHFLVECRLQSIRHVQWNGPAHLCAKLYPVPQAIPRVQPSRNLPLVHDSAGHDPKLLLITCGVEVGGPDCPIVNAVSLASHAFTRNLQRITRDIALYGTVSKGFDRADPARPSYYMETRRRPGSLHRRPLVISRSRLQRRDSDGIQTGQRVELCARAKPTDCPPLLVRSNCVGR
jgi:hypothetical protein